MPRLTKKSKKEITSVHELLNSTNSALSDSARFLDEIRENKELSEKAAAKAQHCLDQSIQLAVSVLFNLSVSDSLHTVTLYFAAGRE
jgi:hypothetical protein